MLVIIIINVIWRLAGVARQLLALESQALSSNAGLGGIGSGCGGGGCVTIGDSRGSHRYVPSACHPGSGCACVTRSACLPRMCACVSVALSRLSPSPQSVCAGVLKFSLCDCAAPRSSERS